MKQLILVILLFLSSRNGITQELNNKKLLDRISKAWNISTLKSIKYQLKQTNSLKIKSSWQNVLHVQQLTLYSPTDDKNDVPDKGKPSRYKFLQAIRANKGFVIPTFIIESYSSGEIINSRNYTIQNYLNSSHVVAYNYYENDWVKVKDTVVSKIDLHSELKNRDNNVYELNGNNDTYVILSEFNSSKILSRYYIEFSLEANNVICKILKMWDKR